MNSVTAWLDRRLYPDFARNWDDKLFRERICSYIHPDAVVLDVGAGAGIVAEMNFRGQVARMCGVDLDPRVETNPMLDEGRIANAGLIPYADNFFDVVFADNVMEHLADPRQVFSEIQRVLKPNGVLLFKTPNVTHYMPTIARLTPHSFHAFINKLRGRAEVDTFPTRYRVNSAKAVARIASETGFDVVRIARIEGRPEYMRITPITYLVGALYERVVNATALLAALRILLIAELRKKEKDEQRVVLTDQAHET
jgi:SAM-dependent methyltransferase